MSGTKFDKGKLSWSLLPFDAVKEVVKVLDLGAKKYSANNWKSLPDFRQRYFDALMRHLVAWQQGETHDTESRLPTMAHVACNALFLLWNDLRRNKEDDQWTVLSSGSIDDNNFVVEVNECETCKICGQTCVVCKEKQAVKKQKSPTPTTLCVGCEEWDRSDG